STSYLLTQQIEFTRARRITFFADKTTIVWRGAAAGIASVFFFYNCQYCITEGFTFSLASNPPTSVIENQGDDTDPNLGGLSSTKMQWRNLYLLGTGTTQNGILNSYATGSGNTGNDFGIYYNCVIQGMTEGQVQLGTAALSGSNMKGHCFYNCTFAQGKSGVKVWNGSINWFFGFMAQHTTSDFWYPQNAGSENTQIWGYQSEGSTRFLITTDSDARRIPFSFIGCRFATNALHADGFGIVQGHLGPVAMRSCEYGQVGQKIPQISVQGNLTPAMIIVEDCALNATQAGTGSYDVPLVVISNGLAVQQFLKGNIYVKDVAGNPATRFKVEPWGTYCGSFTIAGAATTTAVVTLPWTYFDTNYFVQVTCQTFNGAAGSNRVVSVARTTTNFTVTIEVAPGGGLTNTYAYQITPSS